MSSLFCIKRLALASKELERVQTMETIRNRALAALLLLGLTACGGATGTPDVPVQKTAKLTFSTVSTGGVEPSAPLGAIQLTVQLPIGVTVTKETCTLSGHNDAGQLQYDPASAFSANNNTVTFAVLTTSSAPIKTGTFADLTCDISISYTLAEFAAATIIKDKQLEGFATGVPVDLTGQIDLGTAVTFGTR